MLSKYSALQLTIFIFTLCSYIFTLWLWIDINRFYKNYDFTILEESFEIDNPDEQVFTMNVNFPSEYYMNMEFPMPENTIPDSIEYKYQYFDKIVNDTSLNFYWKIFDSNQHIIRQDSTQSVYDRRGHEVNARKLGVVNFKNNGNYTFHIVANKLVPELFQSKPEITIRSTDYKANNYYFSIIWAFIFNFLFSVISVWIIAYNLIRKNK